METYLGEADEKGMGFRVRIDGRPVMPRQPRDAEELVEVWSFDTRLHGRGRLFIFLPLAEDLEPGKHALEIIPAVDEAGEGAELHIESVLALGQESPAQSV